MSDLDEQESNAFEKRRRELTVGSSMAMPWVFSAEIRGLLVEAEVLDEGGGDGLLVFGVVGRENIVFGSSSWNGEWDMLRFVNARNKNCGALSLSPSISF